VPVELELIGYSSGQHENQLVFSLKSNNFE